MLEEEILIQNAIRSKQPKVRRLFGLLITLILSVVGSTFVIFAIIGGYYWFSISNITNTEQVLGESTTNGLNQIVLPKGKNPGLNQNLSIKLTSGIQEDNVFLYDNLNRQFIEGITRPNSYIEFEMSGVKQKSMTNPNGTFSFKLPERPVQFSIGTIHVYNNVYQPVFGVRFVLILKSFFNRTYYWLPSEKQVFSLELDGSFSSERDNFAEAENVSCRYTLDGTVNKSTFDFTKDLNVVIFPEEISELDFSTNKYVTFRAEALEGFELGECVTKWKNFSDTLEWHSEQIEEIFDESIRPVDVSPLSAPSQ